MIVLLIVVAMYTGGSACPLQKTKDQERAYSVSESNDLFTRSFFDVLREQPGNLFFSPVSIQASLGMLYSGATGWTAEQLRTYGYLPESKEDASQILGTALHSLNQKDGNYTLNLANAIVYDQRLQIEKKFLSQVTSGYKAAQFSADFSDSVGTAKKINTWVEEQTSNKIKDLLKPEDLKDVVLALLNAVYFKGSWKSPFKRELTSKHKFHKNNQQSVTADFMYKFGYFNVGYNSDLDAQILELPYEGNVSMIVVVPTEIEGLRDIEPKLRNISIKQIINEPLYGRFTDVRMPKFKVETTVDLKKSLSQMGMSDMFDQDAADFRDISSSQRIFISKAIQKAFIAVNEEGTEAAAATALLAVPSSAPFYVTMDRPFIYCILHKPSDTVLFLGRLSSP